MKIKNIVTVLLVAIILVSCVPAAKVVPTETVAPTEMAASTPTITPAPTATSIPITFTPSVVITPSLIFSSYPTKQILLEYGNEGGFGDFNDILGRTSYERLVLYSDGQLIISKDYQFFEKMLSPSETEQLLLRLENMGFYSLETNQDHNETDKLYDFGSQYQRVYDGPIYYLSVYGNKPRTICYYGPYQDFLIPEAKGLFGFINEFAPDSMTPYKPDRVLLAIYKGTNPSLTDEQTVPFSWPSDLSPLETPDWKFMYLEGISATEVATFFSRSYDVNFLDEKGNDYSVSIHVVLPHENLQKPQEWVCSK